MSVSSPLLAKEICRNLPTPPDSFFGMKKVYFEQFDDARLGIGLKYSSKREVFSVYKFDYGYERIDGQLLETFTKLAVKEIGIIAKRQSENVRIGSRLAKVSSGRMVIQNFLVFGKRKGVLRFHFLGIGTNGICIIKFRYTYTHDFNLRLANDNYEKYLLSVLNYIDGS